MFDEFRLEVDEYLDAGDHVVAIGTSRGIGKGGGVPVEVPLCLLLTFVGGRIVRGEEFLNSEEALAAAGLAPG